MGFPSRRKSLSELGVTHKRDIELHAKDDWPGGKKPPYADYVRPKPAPPQNWLDRVLNRTPYDRAAQALRDR